MTWCRRSWRSLSIQDLPRLSGRVGKKVVTRKKATNTLRLAAASGSPIRGEGDARLEFVVDGKKCNMKFLGAVVERPLASVSAIVDEGNIVEFGPQESYIENTSTRRRIPISRSACGRTSGFENDETCDVRRAEHE